MRSDNNSINSAQTNRCGEGVCEEGGGEGGVDHMISEKQKPMLGERNGGGGRRGEGGKGFGLVHGFLKLPRHTPTFSLLLLWQMAASH